MGVIACIFAGLMIISRTLLYLDEKEESLKQESDLVSSQKMKTLLAGNKKWGWGVVATYWIQRKIVIKL